MSMFDDPQLCKQMYNYQEQEIIKLKQRIKALEQVIDESDAIFRKRYKHVFALAHEPNKYDDPGWARFDPPPLNGKSE